MRRSDSTATSKSNSILQNVRLRAFSEYEHLAGNIIQSRSEILAKSSPMRAFCFNMLESSPYLVSMGIIILTNALFVIRETDKRASHEDDADWMHIASPLFLITYAIEILVRIYVFRLQFLFSGWNLLDLAVVITDGCVEISKGWTNNDIPSVSILRIFRLVRLVRLIAMLQAFIELRTMLLGFVSTLKAIIWASVMIALVLTCCSVVAVEYIRPLNEQVAQTGVYGDCERCGRAFETVGTSNLTFIQQIVAGDSWGTITMPIIEAYPGTSVFFLTILCLIDLGLLNLILTVIVNAAEAARTTNYEMSLREKAVQTERTKERLQRLCSTLDQDNDHRISLKEFFAGIDGNEEFRKTLALLDIQRQDAEVVYHLMDHDNTGDVDYNEFIHTMMATKHEHVNTKLLFLKADMHQMLVALERQGRDISKKLVGDVTEAVNEAMKNKSTDLGSQPDKVVSESERCMQKIDRHFELLQEEQATNRRALEKTLAEVSGQGHSAEAGSSRQHVQPHQSSPSYKECNSKHQSPAESGTNIPRLQVYQDGPEEEFVRTSHNKMGSARFEARFLTKKHVVLL